METIYQFPRPVKGRGFNRVKECKDHIRGWLQKLANCRHRFLVLLVLSMSVLMTCLVMPEPVSAGIMDFNNPLYTELQAFAKMELTSGMQSSIDAIFGSGDTDEYANTINQMFLNVNRALNNTDYYKPIATAVKGLALFMVVMYSFLALFKELQRGDGSFEIWSKCLVMLAFGMITVLNWEPIINALETLGIFIKNQVINALGSISADSSTDFNILTSWFDSTFPEKQTGIPSVLGSVELFAIIFFSEFPLMLGRGVLLTILIELVVRKAFFPLAIANVCGNGMRSPGVAYMKKLLALYIRIAICFVIAFLGNIIVGAIMTTPISGTKSSEFLQIVCMGVVYLTCARLYAATSSIASQIVGMP